VPVQVRLYSKVEIAELFRCSEREITRWISDGLTATKVDGAYRIEVFNVHAYLLDKFKASLLVDEEGKVLDLELEKAKLARSQTAQIDLKIAERKEELISIVDIKLLVSQVILSSKAQIEKIPSRAASMLDLSRSDEQLLRTFVCEILEGIADGESIPN